MRALGQPSERGAWYHVYLNGQYWGLYNTCERPEENFAASYLGGEPEDYDVLKANPGQSMVPIAGNDEAWNRLWQSSKAGFAANSAYFKVQGRNPDGSTNPAYENLLDVGRARAGFLSAGPDGGGMADEQGRGVVGAVSVR